MSKTLKQVRAGRLVCAVVYTTAAAGDSPRARTQKQRASTAARDKLNARTSFQKLERTLAANFDNGDLFITLTYDDTHLPEDREAAIRRIRSFLSKLRKARKPRGQLLHYIYVTEGGCPGGRLHHHLVVNSTGEDLEEIRPALDLWRQCRGAAAGVQSGPHLRGPGQLPDQGAAGVGTPTGGRADLDAVSGAGPDRAGDGDRPGLCDADGSARGRDPAK